MADPFALSALKFLTQADELRGLKRWREAAFAYEAALANDKAQAAAWLGLGVCAEEMGETQKARDAFAKSAELDPGSLNAWLGLASALQRSGDGAGALSAWLAASRLAPGDFRIHNLLWQGFNEIETAGQGYAAAIACGNRLRGSERFDEALAAYRQAQEMEPSLPFAYSRAGCLLAKQGRYAEAETQFARARALVDWVESGIRLDAAFFHRRPNYPHEFSMVQTAGPCQRLVLVGCDGGYFQRYAALLADSLARHEGAETQMHVHLVSPSPEVLAAARAAGFGVSVEYPDFKGRSRNFVNTYYACSRFLALPQLLKSYERPLLVMDVDALVLAPLAPLWAVLKENDMAVRRLRGPMVDPWNEAQANLVGVNPTGLGAAFAASVAAFLAEFVTKGMLYGFFDQTALYSVLAADPALTDIKEGGFPGQAYGYPTNRGAPAAELCFPPELLVGEVK